MRAARQSSDSSTEATLRDRDRNWTAITLEASSRRARKENMTTEKIVEAEVVETGTDLEVRPEGNVNLFGTSEPADVVRRAGEVADVLSSVLREKKLIQRIGSSDHVRVEGWTLCGSMLGVFPFCVWTRKLEDGWEARVEARTLNGAVVGSAEAECLRSENTWKNRDDYALRSMAQTRATSKALRQPLGFIVQLAGFNPTPAEEMPASSKRSSATFASDNEVTRMLDLATKVGEEAHAKADEAVAAHREAHDGRVESGWLKRQVTNLTKKLPEGEEPPADGEDIPF